MAKIHTCNVKIYLLYIYKKQDKKKKYFQIQHFFGGQEGRLEEWERRISTRKEKQFHGVLNVSLYPYSIISVHI